MRYCQRCLYPENHPLGIVFDDEGICSGCRVHEEKDSFDWQARFAKLELTVKALKADSQRNYDCIVPVSGARDSYFIVHTVKNVLKLNPLLVSYNRQYNTNRGHRNYAYLKTLFNCDAVEMVLDPARVKRVARESLRRLGSFHWPVLAGQTAFPVQVAVRYKIPLIIWGHHQGLDQVGMYSHADEVEMTRRYRKEHDLMGWEAEDLAKGASEMREEDAVPFLYPHDKEIEKVGVRGIYLGNYIRWDSKAQHERMIDTYGYETACQLRTFDTYNDVDCHHYSGAHDYVKFLKWGYGKVTDHATREIRLKRLTRAQGIDLVRKFENVAPTDLPLLLNWMNLTQTEFFAAVDKFRDARAWEKISGSWRLKDSVTRQQANPGMATAALPVSGQCDFRVTRSRAPAEDQARYQLLHKGFVHEHRY